MSLRQEDLWSGEAHARSTDPETSHSAARTATKTLTVVKGRIIALLQIQGALTDEELCKVYHQTWPDSETTDQSIRSRRSELVASGNVAFSGDYGYTFSGNKSRRWQVVRFDA